MTIEARWKKAFEVGRSATGCTFSQPEIPGLRHYYVVSLDAPVGPQQAERFFVLAHQTARWLGHLHFGDPECYALMYRGGRTRRKPWPHVHIVVANSVAQRRRAVLLLQLKHLLRWRRWPSLVAEALRYPGPGTHTGLPPSSTSPRSTPSTLKR